MRMLDISARTGSTLLGELLAASPDTAYFMEPLFGLLPVGQLDWDYVLEDNIQTGRVPLEAVTALMGGVYRSDCSTSMSRIAPRNCFASSLMP